jgi:LysM repeat protein
MFSNRLVTIALLSAVAVCTLPALNATAAETKTTHPSGKELDHEYAEVRKLALRDPKVQAAFDQAEQKLRQRMLEIDPALAPIINKQPASTAASTAAPEHAHLQHFKGNTTSASQPTAAATGEQSGGHVVAKGETLSAIAARYKVTVAALKEANHISDERKLRVGQKLVIPHHHANPTAAAPANPTPAPAANTAPASAAASTPTPAPQKDDNSIWSRITKSLQ